MIDESKWPQSSRGVGGDKLHKRLRQRHDLEVELEIGNVGDEGAVPWEEQAMNEDRSHGL